MNVAIFASAFHPHMGGVEELCRQLAHSYQQRGWKVCVLTNRWPRDLPAHELVEGIPVYRVAMRTPDSGLKSKITFKLTSGLIEQQIAGILRAQGVEVVHIQCVGCNGYYAARAAKQLGLPLVVTLQGELTMDATRLYERSPFARATLQTVLQDAAMITACSGQTLQEAELFYGKPFGSRGLVIRNGVRCADFEGVTPFAHPRPYVLGIGRHVAQKGFDVLLRAMAQRWQEGETSMDLVLAGDGPENAPLRALAAELGVQDRVHFTGRVDRPRAATLFAGCEIFVLASRHEPFGIVNLEAMASGKPVIATRVGGVPEIVRDGENGLLVPAEDPGAMAAAIARLQADPALRARLAEAGRTFAQAHDWAKLTDEYGAVYRSVLAPARQAA